MSETLEMLKRLALGEKFLDVVGYAEGEWMTLDPDAKPSQRFLSQDKESRKTAHRIYAYFAHKLEQELTAAAPGTKDRVRSLWEVKPEACIGWTYILKKLGVKDDASGEISEALNDLVKEGFLIKIRNNDRHLVYKRSDETETKETAGQVYVRHFSANTLCVSRATYYRRVKDGWNMDKAATTPVENRETLGETNP